MVPRRASPRWVWRANREEGPRWEVPRVPRRRAFRLRSTPLPLSLPLVHVGQVVDQRELFTPTLEGE